MKYETIKDDGDWKGRVRVTAEPNDELTSRGIQTLEIELHEGPGKDERVADVYDDKGAHIAGFIAQPAEDKDTSELERQADAALREYLRR